MINVNLNILPNYHRNADAIVTYKPVGLHSISKLMLVRSEQLQVNFLHQAVNSPKQLFLQAEGLRKQQSGSSPHRSSLQITNLFLNEVG